MKAITLQKFGGAENFRFEERPKIEPGEGELQVAVKAVSFNPVDVYQRLGKLSGELPALHGRDMSGIVEAVGGGVTDFKPGDEVYARVGSGTYAEFVTAPAEFFSPKPAGLSFAESAAVPVAGMTAYEAVFNKARVERGQSVLVAGGAGGVGSMAVQMLRHLGADPLIVTAGSEKSAAYLTNFLGAKADRVLFYQGLSVEQLKRKVDEMSGGKGIDAAFDFVGGAMKRLCFEGVRAGGQVVSIVEEPADFALNLWDENTSPLIMKSLSFHFVQLAARAVYGKRKDWLAYRRMLDEIGKLFEAKILNAPKIQAVGEFSVETVRRAHEMLETGHTQGKLVMTIGAIPDQKKRSER
jgi:NADPH:quinone reductase